MEADSSDTGVVFDAALVYGQADSTLTRNLLLGGSTAGKGQSSEYQAQLGVAFPSTLSNQTLTITPSLHLVHSSFSQGALTESGTLGLEAKVGSQSANSTATRLGVQAAKLLRVASKSTRLTANLDWVHSFEKSRNEVNIGFVGSPTGATARFQSSKAGQDAIRLGLGAEMAFTDRTRLRLNLEQQVQSNQSTTYGGVTLGVQF